MRRGGKALLVPQLAERDCNELRCYGIFIIYICFLFIHRHKRLIAL